MPITSTTKVCIVIGTGQNGICVFADTVNASVPPSASSTLRATRALTDCAGQSVLARVGVSAVNYFAPISATVVSSMRFEKPHSLSYHEQTFTRRPATLVQVASNTELCGLWLKSLETSGPSL